MDPFRGRDEAAVFLICFAHIQNSEKGTEIQPKWVHRLLEGITAHFEALTPLKHPFLHFSSLRRFLPVTYFPHQVRLPIKHSLAFRKYIRQRISVK